MQCLCEKIPTIWRILCNQKAWFDVLWIFSVMKLIWVAVHRLACILHIYIARDSGQTTQISVTLFINELVSSYVPCTYHAVAILNIENICQAEYWGKPNTFSFSARKNHFEGLFVPIDRHKIVEKLFLQDFKNSAFACIYIMWTKGLFRGF